MIFENHRFKFTGFGSPGYCYVKALIRPESVVVLCSQLVDYHGTSVTKGLEDIRDSLIRELQGSGMLNEFKGGDRLVPLEFPYDLYERMAWIEHYPAGAKIGGDASYAYVSFIRGIPAWAYMPAEQIAKFSEVPESFLELEREELIYA